ncbi:hypothetical protein F8279_05190 [Micromonospora sp. AMSO1212t]|uniref:hypothetical protein n=1 Tax=Micromonospora sp. AMSO1212t TaxID=2650565 RepID=UPI00124B802A|nr:hypothetical protein [Micromonospora sp. AMSO1212t]KAB1908910.1 hypothetical protein F8279_05190 [Micromonospora sp. AMSO1212t]
MRRKLLASLLLVVVVGGCGTGSPDASSTPTASASAVSGVGGPASDPPGTPTGTPSSSATVQPRFADLTQGSTTSVVTLHSYDPANASAVVEPIIFMTADAYCRAFKIERSDGRCTQRAYMTEESHTKVTVPLADEVDYFTWENAEGDVCMDAPEKGGTCPMTGKQFAAWFALNKRPMVAVATELGVITRMAIVYTP